MCLLYIYIFILHFYITLNYIILCKFFLNNKIGAMSFLERIEKLLQDGDWPLLVEVSVIAELKEIDD